MEPVISTEMIEQRINSKLPGLTSMQLDAKMILKKLLRNDNMTPIKKKNDVMFYNDEKNAKSREMFTSQYLSMFIFCEL